MTEAIRNSNLREDDVKSRYYNYEEKMNYLDTHSGYKEDTKRVLRAFFRKIGKLERELGKDLYDFNERELRKLFIFVKASTLRSLHNTVSLVGKYIDYAMSKKLSVHTENFAYYFSSQEVAMKLLDKEANERIYLNRSDVMYMAKNSINEQDGVILALLHDGFSHKENFNELVNLKVSDIDWDMETAKITSRKNGNDIIHLSKETILLLKKAISTDIYYSISDGVEREYKMRETNYVLRGVRAKHDEMKIAWRNINQRILRLSEFFDNDYLTATNIVVSSQIDTANELYLEDKDIGDRAIKQALEKFNFPYNKSSLFNLKKKVKLYKGTYII